MCCYVCYFIKLALSLSLSDTAKQTISTHAEDFITLETLAMLGEEGLIFQSLHYLFQIRSY